MAGTSSLPADIVDAIAISNAKSIGEQPAILSNLALATEIANVNIQQQIQVNQQQVLLNISVMAAAKTVEAIAGIDATSPNAIEQIKSAITVVDSLTLS